MKYFVAMCLMMFTVFLISSETQEIYEMPAPEWVFDYQQDKETFEQFVPVSDDTDQQIRACNQIQDPDVRQMCLDEISK